MSRDGIYQNEQVILPFGPVSASLILISFSPLWPDPSLLQDVTLFWQYNKDFELFNLPTIKCPVSEIHLPLFKCLGMF